jgi:hypothetical protein
MDWFVKDDCQRNKKTGKDFFIVWQKDKNKNKKVR